MALNKDQVKAEYERLKTSLRRDYDVERAALTKAREQAKANYDREVAALNAARDAGRITSAERSASRDQLYSQYQAALQANDQRATQVRSTYDQQRQQAQAERDRNVQLASMQAAAAREEARIARRNDPEALAAYRAQVAAEQNAFMSNFARENPSFAAAMQQQQQSNQQLQNTLQQLGATPIPQAQAPELTREYYLSRGYPESMLPPAPGQLHSAGVTQPSSASVPQPSAAQPTGQSFLTGTNMANPLNPANLPALRGAASGTSSIDPTLRPYLELGLRGAEQLFLQQQPSLYPGQMFVGPSEQTQAALNMQEDIALARPAALEAAQESYMRGLGGLAATAGGSFLGMNPFQMQAIQAATRPLAQQYEQQVLPGVSSMFSRAGRYGSEAMGTALGRATEASARAIGDVSSNIAYQGYEAERARQQQALGMQLQGATLAPQIYGQQFLPSQQLAQVGAAREAIAAQPLQEAITRYNFQQQVPYQQLQGFLSSVYGTPMASSQYAPPAQTNQIGQAIGGATLGYLGGQMFPSIGGTTGAILGGLGGLLF